jgi:hypothetical protein
MHGMNVKMKTSDNDHSTIWRNGIRPMGVQHHRNSIYDLTETRAGMLKRPSLQKLKTTLYLWKRLHRSWMCKLTFRNWHYQDKSKVEFDSVQSVIFIQIPWLHCQSSCGVRTPHFGHICKEAPTWCQSCITVIINFEHQSENKYTCHIIQHSLTGYIKEICHWMSTVVSVAETKFRQPLIWRQSWGESWLPKTRTCITVVRCLTTGMFWEMRRLVISSSCECHRV